MFNIPEWAGIARGHENAALSWKFTDNRSVHFACECRELAGYKQKGNWPLTGVGV